MKILLITKDNKMLYDSTGEEVLYHEDVDIASSGDNLVLKLNKDYNSNSYITVVPGDDGEIGYITDK